MAEYLKRIILSFKNSYLLINESGREFFERIHRKASLRTCDLHNGNTRNSAAGSKKILCVKIDGSYSRSNIETFYIEVA